MLAIHWAQTTHGTWLHGNARGSWENGRLISADPNLEEWTRAFLTEDAIVLDAAERRLVADEFAKIVQSQRHRIFAATVRATHIHLVFGPLREDVKTVIARFKYRSALAVFARRAKRQPAGMAGLYSRAVPARRPTSRSLWTAGRFPVFIFNELHLTNAIEYVRDHNRRDGLAPDPYPWIDPLFPASEMAGERMTRTAACEELPW
jgi:hypothetical protein